MPVWDCWGAYEEEGLEFYPMKDPQVARGAWILTGPGGARGRSGVGQARCQGARGRATQRQPAPRSARYAATKGGRSASRTSFLPLNSFSRGASALPSYPRQRSPFFPPPDPPQARPSLDSPPSPAPPHAPGSSP
ncbi:hypothetical protein H1C71_021958, partial [Ictidomys tridecemlineatus]